MFKSVKMSFKSFVVKFKSLYISKFSAFKRRKPKMIVDVLVFGSSSIEYITYVNELPTAGATTIGLHREQCYGGKAANQCVAAAKLGGKCALVSKLGHDPLGDQYLEYLKTLEINVEFVEQLEGECTGLSEISRADNSQNTVIVLPNANTMLKTPDVARCKKLFKRAKVLICQLETEEKAVMSALHQFKGVSILNASPVSGKVNLELLKVPTILCINAAEAAQLTDRKEVETLQDAKAAANDLIDMGAKSVIITMGSLGAVYLSSKQRDFCIQCPAAPVRFLADSSGASDAFVGSLAYHISAYPNLCRESHINAANICAAYSVGHRGTQPSFPGPELAHQTLCQIAPQYNVIPDEHPAASKADGTAATTDTKAAEEPKAAEPTTAEPKAEEPIVEQPTAEEPKAEEPKSEERKPEELKSVERKSADRTAEERKSEEPKAEESKAKDQDQRGTVEERKMEPQPIAS